MSGRRLFDLTNGWAGVPPVGQQVIVVTHQEPTDWPYPDAPYTFVTTGLRDAVERARELAGDGVVSLTAGDLTAQAIAEGLVDEIGVALVPVVFGRGVRFFGEFVTAGAGSALILEDPEIVAGDRVTHLHSGYAGSDVKGPPELSGGECSDRAFGP